MAQTSWPERTRNLPKGHLDLSDVDLTRETLSYLLGRGTFEEQIDRLREVLSRGFDGIALAGDVELGAKGDVPVALAFDDRRESFVSSLPFH